MKIIQLEIPDGKEAKWVDCVLTLVDEKPKDITERIKTFEDACNELGEDNPFVKEYRQICFTPVKGETVYLSKDIIAYLKLRIICAALNESWEPQFTTNEYRYFPWFWLYTKEKYDNMDEEQKGRCVLRSGHSTFSNFGFVYCNANFDASNSFTNFGSRLAFRTRELAEYAGKQFIEEWADFVFKSE